MDTEDGNVTVYYEAENDIVFISQRVKTLNN